VLSIGNFVITNTVISNATSIAANTGVSIRWVKITKQILQ
jgi:hypothetical protein